VDADFWVMQWESSPLEMARHKSAFSAIRPMLGVEFRL
jgi:hypothetical protein